MTLKPSSALVVSAALCGSLASSLQAGPPVQALRPPGVSVIRFSRYEWEVRSNGEGGPGPNRWSRENVWVDRQGRLHLKLTRQGSAWQCAEVSTRRSFGLGRYRFQVTGVLDRLDPHVVFGLFCYPPAAVGPDGTNEIDIEYSRWGRPAALPGSYTVYPPRVGAAQVSQSFPMPTGLSDTTQRFDRESDGLRFESLRGHREDDGDAYAHRAYHPADRGCLPRQPLPVHINLWLTGGKPPVDGKDVEVVVKRFSFTPIAP